MKTYETPIVETIGFEAQETVAADNEYGANNMLS